GVVAASSVLLAVPLLRQRTFGAMIGDVVIGKDGSYLAVEGQRLFPGLSGALSLLTHPNRPPGRNVIRLVGIVAILAAAVVLVAAWRSVRSCRVDVTIACMFAVVGFVAAAPDFGRQHTVEAAPILVGVVGTAFVATSPRRISLPKAWR